MHSRRITKEYLTVQFNSWHCEFSGYCFESSHQLIFFKVTDRMLCAGHGPSSPTGGCHGDSGGPFVCQTGLNGAWVLHGAVSWGSGRCNTTEAYTVFSRITYFRDWIDTKMATN